MRSHNGIREDGKLPLETTSSALRSPVPGRFVFTRLLGNDPHGRQKWFLDAPSIREAILAARGKTDGNGPRQENVDDITIFICGPPAMHRFLEGELARFSLPPGRIRREDSGALETLCIESSADVVYSMRVADPFGNERVIEALASETVLTALERAGMNPPSRCRSGHCGFCRAKLVSGKVASEMRAEEFLRAADRKFGYFHPCSAYPRSDLSIRIPENPV